MKRALLVSAALAVAGCDNVATITVENARTFRDPENRVIVDVDLVAAEQSGKSVGQYCVSIHVLPVGFDPLTPPLLVYAGQFDRAITCANDLHDGDLRTLRLVTNRRDIGAGAPIRVQTQLGRTVVDTMEVNAP